MTEDKAQALSATPFEPASVITEPGTETSRGGTSRAVFIGGGIGVALLLFVFFVLPKLVSPDAKGVVNSLVIGDAISNTSDNPRSEPSSNTAVANVEGRSPFAEAQESALRREAQEVLQSLLKLQESLTERGAAKRRTHCGEAWSCCCGRYRLRERDFTGATAEYQLALDGLIELEASLPKRIEALYHTLVTAIENADVLATQGRFSELAEIAPADVRLIALEARIAALPAVIAALDTAAEREASGNLGAAVEAATEATRADTAHQRAAARLIELRSALTRQQFTTAMTAGYGALAGQNFNAAEAQFRKAAALYPGAPEPASALSELEQARTQKRLLDLKAQGELAESDERWNDAASLYKQALEIDALMLFATEGLARSTPRAELDERLRKIPNERDRLIDARIMGVAESTLSEAETIADPGSRLQAQILAAKQTLAYASTPVPVTIQTDGLTDITLLRVKRLGTLSSQSLSLRPGRYTAVGMRNGFRDVRIQFDVRPDQANAVEVRCVETIEFRAMTDNDNKLTPNAFSPASPAGPGSDEQLAAMRFEPLSEAGDSTNASTRLRSH